MGFVRRRISTQMGRFDRSETTVQETGVLVLFFQVKTSLVGFQNFFGNQKSLNSRHRYRTLSMSYIFYVHRYTSVRY